MTSKLLVSGSKVDTALPPCSHCGGRLRLERDEYGAFILCWNCERAYAQSPIPALSEIEEDDDH